MMIMMMMMMMMMMIEMEDGINRSLRMQTLTGLQNCVFDEAKALF